jgi:N6-L-threonylcarbamoyladenine synthase
MIVLGMNKPVFVLGTNKSLIILGIDTSCDDTGVGIVKDGVILANIIASQSLHRAFGGIMPELASRAHLESINQVVQLALSDANIGLEDIDVIAVTQGPGLAGSLLIGLMYAKGLAFGTGKTFYAMHHLEGHIQSAIASAPTLEPPFLALIASGGHTHLFDCVQAGQYSLIGATRDDAAGEAFDKVARLLELGFPGGPAISKAALTGNDQAYGFTIPLLGQSGFDFSYSGIKNQARLAVEARNMGKLEISIEDLAASFERIMVESLVQTTLRAAKAHSRTQIVVAGGVAANQRLRKVFTQRNPKVNVIFPPAQLNTDNGAMIALAAWLRASRGDSSDSLDVGVRPNWDLATYSAVGKA